MSEFPVFTGRFYTRQPRASVPVDTLNSVSLYGPDEAIGINTATNPDEYYNATGGQTEIFPHSQSGEYGEPLPEILNLQQLDRASLGYFPAEHSSITPEDRGDATPLYYEDLVCNAYYNVKTWQVSASAGGVSVSETIYAGASGSNGSPGTRPLSGKRYKFGATGSFSDSSGDEFLSLQITIGLGARFPVENLYSAPVDSVMLPNISGTFNYSDSGSGESRRLRVVGLNSPDTWIDNSTEDSNFTFLGVPVFTHEDISGTTGYSISITASEWWTSSDDWYS